MAKAKIDFVPHPAATEHVLLEPQLFLLDGTTIFGDLAIARLLARRAALHLIGGTDAFSSSEVSKYGFLLWLPERDHHLSYVHTHTQVDQWLDFVQQYHLALSLSDFQAFLSTLNLHLELRTYIVGYQPSVADVAVYVFLQVR